MCGRWNAPPWKLNAAPQAAARIARLQDETDVQNLQHAFGYYLDRKLYDDATDAVRRERRDEVRRGCRGPRCYRDQGFAR